MGSGSAASSAGMTPKNNNLSAIGYVMSPPSTTSTATTNKNAHSQSDFFPALSPATTKYLRVRNTVTRAGVVGVGAATGATAATEAGGTGGMRWDHEGYCWDCGVGGGELHSEERLDKRSYLEDFKILSHSKLMIVGW